MSRRLAWVILPLVMVASACSGGDGQQVATGPTPTGDKYDVLSTAYPVYEATTRLGGDRFHASNLRPESALSTAPLTADEKRQITDASVLFLLGHGAQPEIEAVAATRVKPTVTVGTPGDPYFWLNPNRMGAMLEQVRLTLTSFDPEAATKFKRAARRYGRSLAALDKKMALTLAACERHQVVTAYPVFDALTRRYRLSQVDASDDRKLAEAVRTLRPRMVFFESLPPLEEAQRRLKDDGYRSAVLNTVVNQSDHARRGGASYEVMMKLNLDAISEALECTEDSERK